MNRILLTILLFTALSAPALNQERTKPVLSPPAAEPQAGSDTAQTGKSDEYVPLWESDTIYKGADSLQRYRQAPLVQGDTTVVEPDYSHSPSQAIMYALVLPGLGQAYNKKYYKMPIVWAALGGAGYAISFNSTQYQLASEAYALTPDDTNERPLKFWRRNLELSYIALIAVYTLQVVDAYVDAQLFYWDVSEDLSMRIAPSLQPLMTPGNLGSPGSFGSFGGQTYGFSCSFNLRR
ncbi:MAG: DUF5683 domain-containing protein [Bacteroidota bacterium]